MSAEAGRLFNTAVTLADQRRLVPAVTALERAIALPDLPARRAFLRYNLGTIHWHHLGDGPAARREFLTAAAEFAAHGYGGFANLKTVHANALENAMLCALSFDEFERLAGELRELIPDVPIVTGLVPELRQWRERGSSWSDRLFALAATYYNRNDPQRDVGRYGEARSTYQLLLTHRRELRLCREDWRMAIFEFCALSMRLATDCLKARGGENDIHPTDEYIVILTEAAPLFDEYLALHPGDDRMKKTRADLQQMIDDGRQCGGAREEVPVPVEEAGDDADAESTPSASPAAEYQVCQRCGTVFAQRDLGGPGSIASLRRSHDHAQVCLRCGGRVEWQQGAEVKRARALGCLSLLFLLIVTGVLVYVFLTQRARGADHRDCRELPAEAVECVGRVPRE